MAVKRTGKILDAGKRESIKRHLETPQTIIKEANQCKGIVEAQKINNKEDISKIDEWNVEIEAKLEIAGKEVTRLKQWLAHAERSEKFVAQEELFKLEMEMHEKKLKMQAELCVSKKNPETVECETSDIRVAKLPKLVISKFDGSFKDWPRFWGQFSEAIDKSSIAPISKLTYLLELLEPKVKRSVEALPFTAEGYNRAKAILEDKYGKQSEIVKCYVKEIVELPYITCANPRKIAEFYEKLFHSVQALETIGKLDLISGNVSMTLDKLSGIRGDLVRTDLEWETWDFRNLTEALKQWVKRNPISVNERDEPNRKKLFHTRDGDFKPRGCVYCGDVGHKANQCMKITDVKARKGILAKNGLCFNCATKKHRASECSSKMSCGHCSRRHHTSICEQKNYKSQDNAKLMTDGVSGDGIFPIVVVKINGFKCRALIDSGAGSSYVSAKLIETVKIKPRETKRQRIDMLMNSKTALMEIFDAKISSIDGNFELDAKLTKVSKRELLTINNPEYDVLIARYQHLNAVRMDDNDTKDKLPIHVILGISEYTRIKTCSKPLVGGPGEPVAEQTKFGWSIMSPGAEFDKGTMLFTQTSRADFEDLCRLDILGLADTPEDQDTVYEDFKERLERDPAGWYETSLPWKLNHPDLPTNEAGSKRRLANLVKRLERNGTYEQYDEIIQDQLKQGVIETAPPNPTKKEFYIPHKGVAKQDAESTKLRIVYDASAKASNTQPSLNDCLNPGPTLQSLLWSILVRARFLPVLLTGDLEKAFLQIRIKEEECDALRFHWKSPGRDDTVVYRFTRALLGLTCSPFLLGGVLNEHLKSWKERYPHPVEELQKGLYVDDLMTGGTTTTEVREKKTKAVEIFEDATFKLHKWHSNVETLECDERNSKENAIYDYQSTFAKQQLGPRHVATKLFGLPWNKKEDTLSVDTANKEPATTKRSALSQLASVYDPLGLISPTTLLGKVLCRKMCEAHHSWDTELPVEIAKQWRDWCLQLPQRFEIPRSLVPRQQPIKAITLHAFDEASKKGVSAAVYAVVEQDQATTRGLVCAKARLAKQNLTIPRLELVAGHIAVNLVTNVEAAIGVEKATEVHCWLDSTVALYWINGRGEYRQFVANRVKKIREHERVIWHHVTTDQNPTDLGSRGGYVTNNELWQHGPSWLSDKTKWPPEIALKPSKETTDELKHTRQVHALVTASPQRDEFDELLESYRLREVLRIGAWIQRFIRNCRNPSAEREYGPLKTNEIEHQNDLVDQTCTARSRQKRGLIEGVKELLNLQPNDTGVLECRRRIAGQYPIFLPEKSEFTRKVVEQARLTTLHGGVASTMARVRERYWVPKLRRMVKKARSDCFGCVKFRSQAYQKPPPGNLPATRTEGSAPFQVLGVDFAGPIRYQSKTRAQKRHIWCYTVVV